MNPQILTKTEEAIRQEIPGFRVQFKDESLTMKVLGFLAYPFNPTFMDDYITTWGTGVYFPSREYYLERPEVAMSVLWHEYVHLWDQKRWGLLFKVSYIMPQVFGLVFFLLFAATNFWWSWLLLVPLAGYVIGIFLSRLFRPLFWLAFGAAAVSVITAAVISTGWWSVFLFAGLALFTPLPSPWRTSWELRGYTMTMAVRYWLTGDFPSREALAEHFVGPGYYFMSWGREGIDASLALGVQRIETGSIIGEHPFQIAYEFFRKNGLLHA